MIENSRYFRNIFSRQGGIIFAVFCCILTLIWISRSYSRTKVIHLEEQLSEQRLLALEEEQIPTVNTLLIPSQRVLIDITEGEYEDDKDYLKTWRRTHTNTPDKGGNTVIVGHRYKNKPEYPLFYIDEIKKDDMITIYWEGEQYDYKVYNTFEVDLFDISVEDPTDEDILTLYACDWSGKNRLIVQAELQ